MMTAKQMRKWGPDLAQNVVLNETKSYNSSRKERDQWDRQTREQVMMMLITLEVLGLEWNGKGEHRTIGNLDRWAIRIGCRIVSLAQKTTTRTDGDAGSHSGLDWLVSVEIQNVSWSSCAKSFSRSLQKLIGCSINWDRWNWLKQ